MNSVSIKHYYYKHRNQRQGRKPDTLSMTSIMKSQHKHCFKLKKKTMRSTSQNIPRDPQMCTQHCRISVITTNRVYKLNRKPNIYSHSILNYSLLHFQFWIYCTHFCTSFQQRRCQSSSFVHIFS